MPPFLGGVAFGVEKGVASRAIDPVELIVDLAGQIVTRTVIVGYSRKRAS